MNPHARSNPTGEPGDEPELVRRAQRGDAAAFAEIVHRYQRSVYRTAYALTRSSADADDLAQETFVRAYQALGRFRADEPLHPWLSRIATNLAFSLFRTRRRRPETSIEPLLEAGRQWGADDDPAESAARSERHERLAAAFDELKPEHRLILTLRVVHDMSYEQIAEHLGVPAGTVMSRLSRARAELRTRFAARTGEGT